MRKVYVDVILRQDKDGKTRPLSITYEDGVTYPVDRMVDVRRAASSVGGCGKRYTIYVRGQQTYLYEDRNLWFVEAKY